jgi:hypothetical protein
MDAGTRLTPHQLAVLAPDGTVTIEAGAEFESGAEFGRTHHTAGTVARVTAVSVVVSVESARGVPYVQEYRLRDGWRAGRGSYGALVNLPSTGTGADEGQRREQRIDVLWRTWSRNRGDVDALRELHAAIGRRLDEMTVSEVVEPVGTQ